MLRRKKSDVWILSRKIASMSNGVPEYIYVNPVHYKLTSQVNIDDVDLQTFGDQVYRTIKCYSDTVPKGQQYDALSFEKPTLYTDRKIEGKMYKDFGEQRYSIYSILPADIGLVSRRNHTAITIIDMQPPTEEVLSTGDHSPFAEGALIID